MCLGLVFLVPVFFYRGTQEIFEVPKVALLVTGALVLLALALAALLGAVAQRGPAVLGEAALGLGKMPRRDPLGFAVLLYLVSCALSTVLAPNPAQSLYGAPESTAGLRTAIATAVVYFAVRSLRGTPERFLRIATAASAAAVVAALYGGLQAIGADPLEWGRTARYGAELRVFGTLGHPNFLGASLAMSVPLMLHGRARAGQSVTRWAWSIALVLTVLVLAATLSRGAWLGFAAGLLSWPVLAARARRGVRRDEPAAAPSAGAGRRGWILAGAVALTLATLTTVAMLTPLGRALESRLGDLVNPRAATTQTRVHIWAAGLRMAASRPWTGVGLDAFGTMFPAHRTAAYWRLEWGATPVKAHNEAIDILATQGVIGGLATLLVVGMVAALLWRVLRARAPEARACAVAVGASLIAFAVQDLASFTVVGLGVPVAALAAWLGAAAEEERAARSSEERARAAPLWAQAVAGAVMLAAFLPLVLRPWSAEAAARRAATMPERSDAQAQWWAAAERQAPWDARYPAQLAFLWYRRAQDMPDSTERRALLARARDASERAVRVEPQSGNYATNLGEIEVEQSLLQPPAVAADRADGRLHRAAALDSANGQNLDRIGFALARLGRRGEARVVASRLAALYPDLGPPLGLLGLMALDERRTQDGIDTLRAALARDWRDQTAPHASAWSNLSVGYLSARRYAEARDAAAHALQLDPSNASAQHNLRLAEGVLGTIGGAGPAR